MAELHEGRWSGGCPFCGAPLTVDFAGDTVCHSCLTRGSRDSVTEPETGVSITRRIPVNARAHDDAGAERDGLQRERLAQRMTVIKVERPGGDREPPEEGRAVSVAEALSPEAEGSVYNPNAAPAAEPPCVGYSVRGSVVDGELITGKCAVCGCAWPVGEECHGVVSAMSRDQAYESMKTELRSGTAKSVGQRTQRRMGVVGKDLGMSEPEALRLFGGSG